MATRKKRNKLGQWIKGAGRKVRRALAGTKRRKRGKGLARASAAGMKAPRTMAGKVDTLMRVAVNHEHRLRHVESKVDTLASAISRLA